MTAMTSVPPVPYPTSGALAVAGRWRRASGAPGGAAVLAAGLLLASALGCATASKKIVYKPEELRAEVARLVPEDLGTVEIPHEIGPELADAAGKQVRPNTHGRVRLQSLVDMVLDVRHDLGVTAAAERVFEERRADCISATSLFVGLARSVGLQVYFVEAVGIEDVSAEDTLDIYHRHVLAAWGASPRATLVDFNRIGTEYVRYRVMSDVEALAHYHNTQGFQALRTGGLDEAERRFRIAVALAPRLAWARNNLGVVLRRQGELAEAEAAFRRAIAIDPAYGSGYANLAILLQATSRSAEAREYRALAEERRARDPLRAFREGRAAFESGEYAAAADHLQRSVRLSPRFVRGWIELARASELAGDHRAAERAIARARRLDPDDPQALAVEQKIAGLVPDGDPARATWPASKLDAARRNGE